MPLGPRTNADSERVPSLRPVVGDVLPFQLRSSIPYSNGVPASRMAQKLLESRYLGNLEHIRACITAGGRPEGYNPTFVGRSSDGQNDLVSGEHHSPVVAARGSDRE